MSSSVAKKLMKGMHGKSFMTNFGITGVIKRLPEITIDAVFAIAAIAFLWTILSLAGLVATTSCAILGLCA
jgi:hypothetical protein